MACLSNNWRKWTAYTNAWKLMPITPPPQYLVEHLGDDPLPFLLLVLRSHVVLVHDPIGLPVLAACVAAVASAFCLGCADSHTTASALGLSLVEHKDLLPANLQERSCTR